MNEFNSREYFASLLDQGGKEGEARIHSEAMEQIVSQQQSIGEDVRNILQEQLHDLHSEMRTSFGLNKDRIVALEQKSEQRAAELRLEIEKYNQASEQRAANLRLEIEKLRSETSQSIEKVRSDLTLEIEKNRNDLRLEIEKTRTEIAHTKYVLLAGIIGTGLTLLFRPYVIEVLKRFFN